MDRTLELVRSETRDLEQRKRKWCRQGPVGRGNGQDEGEKEVSRIVHLLGSSPSSLENHTSNKRNEMEAGTSAAKPRKCTSAKRPLAARGTKGAEIPAPSLPTSKNQHVARHTTTAR